MEKERYDIALHGLWNTDNWGAHFTYWALIRVLQQMGKRVLLVDARSEKKSVYEDAIRFFKKWTDVSDPLLHAWDLEQLNKYCDTFMIGSDQCFRNCFVEYCNYPYLLDYVYHHKRKICFGTSFGCSGYEGDENALAYLGKCLKRFDAIALRERSGVDFVKREFGLKAEAVVDPCFLAKREWYDELMEPVEIKNDRYSLCVCLDMCEEVIQYCSVFSEYFQETLVKIYALGGENPRHVKMDGFLIGLSDGEALKYVKESSYIFADSFHMMCFAIIFQIPFSVWLNHRRGDERILELAGYLGLEKRIVQTKEQLIQNYKTQIDWEAVQDKLSVYRKKSLRWLEEHIGCNHDNCETQADVLRRRLVTVEKQVFRLNNIVVKERELAITRYFRQVIREKEKIAIRGGGFHTNMLLQLLTPVLEEKGAFIVGIVDRKPEKKEVSGHNYKWFTPEQWDGIDCTAALISSGQHRVDFLREIESMRPDVSIYDLYILFDETQKINLPAYYGI